MIKSVSKVVSLIVFFNSFKTNGFYPKFSELFFKERQSTPGGMKLNIVLSPAINTLNLK